MKIIIFLLTSFSCIADTFKIEFDDGLAYQGDKATSSSGEENTFIGLSHYEESGFRISSEDDYVNTYPAKMGVVGHRFPKYANSGSDYIGLPEGFIFKVSAIDSGIFSPISVRLSELYAHSNEPMDVVFTAKFSDESTAQVMFVTDGVNSGNSATDFQVFYFPESFNDVVTLETSAVGVEIAIDDFLMSVGDRPLPPLPPVELGYPDLYLQKNKNGSITIYFTGVLSQSDDLVEWRYRYPRIESPYTFSPIGSQYFFRAVEE